MYTFTSNLEKNEYDKFVENYPMASFMQEYEWANIKDNWGNFHCGLYKDDKLVAVCMILVKTVFKNIKLFYIPRGYLIDFNNLDDLKEMTNQIKFLAKQNHAYVVKIDPNFCISDNSFKNEEVEHNYSKDYEIKHNNLIKLGYKHTGINKDLHTNLQPQYNVFAPMCDINSNILTSDEVLKTYGRIKSYCGNYHTKRGISFEITNDINRVDDLVELLKQTEKKQNINLRNKDYFVRIMENFKDSAYLVFGYIDLTKYLNFLKENGGKEEAIEEANNLIKEYGNTMTLSTALILLPKNKIGIRTSEYLYAGNSLHLTNLHVSVGLVFEIIKFSIENNCHYCNLGGVDGNLNDRLTTFKQRFNGRIMEFTGEYDLPTSWIYYPIKIFYPLLKKLYKLIKR